MSRTNCFGSKGLDIDIDVDAHEVDISIYKAPNPESGTKKIELSNNVTVYLNNDDDVVSIVVRLE